MRIAYVCADLGVPVFGSKGCSIHVREVLRALSCLGARVDLFAARLGGEPPADLAAIDVHELPAPSSRDPETREKFAFAANSDLRKGLERLGPFDLVYERHALWSFAAMEYARDTGTAGILEVNAPLVDEQAEHRSLSDRPRAEESAGRAFDAASAIVAVSAELARFLETQDSARGKIHVVPNGVRPERFGGDIEPCRPGLPGSFTVGFLGTLKPWHGLPLLARAFAALHRNDSGVRLLVVGDGPDRESLEKDLAERGVLGSALVTGVVSPERVPGWLASMDAAVAPYPNAERFYFSPLKVYEYMAAGLAVVATDAGQVGDLIEDGVNGLLCPAGDEAALTHSLDRLRRDPALRRRLGDAARRTIERDHTWQAVARRILAIAAARPAEKRAVSG